MLRWTVHLKGVPTDKYQPAAVAVRHKVYTLGGSTFSTDQIHVNVFNTVTLLWTKLPPETNRKGKRPRRVPLSRGGHTSVLIEDMVYICGGETDRGQVCTNKPYAFDVCTHRWSKPAVSGTVPMARGYGAACALDRIMYLHGGVTQDYNYANDIHKLDTRTMVWSAIVPEGGNRPPHSSEHSANVIGTKIFVFGGKREGVVGFSHNYVRVFDTTTSRWCIPLVEGIHPGQRLYHSAFTWHGELYVFGSKKQKKPRHLWKFSPESFSWETVRCEGKGPSEDWMCCCMVGDRVVLFGGFQGFNMVHDDLYVLDLSPSLKTLCKLVVIKHSLNQAELPHNIRWDMEAMKGKEHTRSTEKKEDAEKSTTTTSHWRY